MVNMVQMFKPTSPDLQAQAAREQVAIALQQQQGQNQGQQQGFDGMNTLLKAYMKSRAPKTYDFSGSLPADAFSEAVPSAASSTAPATDAAAWAAPSAESLGTPAAPFTMPGAVPSAAPAGGGAGGGAVAGGLAAGAASMLALAVFNNYFRQNHEKTAQDYLKEWGGQHAKAQELAAQYGAAGNTAEQQHYQAVANTTAALASMTNRGLAGGEVGKVTTTPNPGYLRNAKVF